MANLMSQMYLNIGGRNVSHDMMDEVEEIIVDTSLHLPNMFTIRFHDPRLKWIDSPILDIGKKVTISGKTEGQMFSSVNDLIKNGEITAIEPDYTEDLGTTLIIRGYDKSHRLLQGKKSRVFQQMSDSDIVKKIAGECGLRKKVDRTSQVYDHVFQVNQTDMEFLQERAERIGYYVFVEEGMLCFQKKPTIGRSSTLTLEWEENLLTFQARLSTAEQVVDTEVHGWDPVQKKAIIGKSTSPKNTPKVKGESHGGNAAKKAFRQKNEEIINDLPVGTQGEADALAQSILNERCQAFFQAEGTCIGDTAVVAGKEVRLKGIGKRFSGRYGITRAIHRYSYSGYTTYFEISGYRANTIGQLLATGNNGNNHGVVVGIVTNVKDPDGLARVKVKFPTISDKLESSWARLVNPMAGPGRGIEFIPEVNDEVLVAFEYGDINKPYILGSLWNGKDKPPEASNNMIAGNGKVQKRIIHSRSGHRITIDDSDGKEKISIVDKTGKNSIDIDSSNNQVAISAEGDIQLAAKGKIKIKGSDIMMEAKSGAKMKAASVNLDASGKAQVKGGSGVDVKASGQMNIESATTTVKGSGMLTLKGGIVKIN